ncbi:hypothetical protein C7999DRAFT_15186, partial [Corynascus novoguineensis]
VAQSYQSSSVGSREFSLRLLQMISIVYHDVAVHLYTKYDGGIRKSPPDFNPQIPTPIPPPGMNFPPLPKMPRRPAEFFHESYMAWKHYPHGTADVVGYWAEHQLFGAVVLFDWGTPGTEVTRCALTLPQPYAANMMAWLKDVYIQPIGRHHIFKLSEAQIRNCIPTPLLEPSPGRHDGSETFRFQAGKYAIRIDPL